MTATQPQPRLWIFGDSFSQCDPRWDPPRTWTRQVAQRLAHELNRPLQLRNHSLMGCNQDWITQHYLENCPEILEQDYVIILLTSPQRTWYFQDQPSLTNWCIVDFDQQITKEQALAVELYIKHLQRDAIDLLRSVNRLGNIAYESAARGHRRPLIIQAFEQDLGPAAQYPDLNIARGALTQIQFGEYRDRQQMLLGDKTGMHWFRGLDCRYNHLCLSNHDLLADRISQALLADQAPDLESGFFTDLVAEDWFKDPEFCERELNPRSVDLFIRDVQHRPEIVPWKQKTGIDQILG